MAEPSPEMPLTSVPIAEPGICPGDRKLAPGGGDGDGDGFGFGLATAGPAVVTVVSTPAASASAASALMRGIGS